MKLFGMEFVSCPWLEPGQMVVTSGNLIYGWDLAYGVDTCVTMRVNPDGSLTVIDECQSDINFPVSKK